MSFVLYRSSRGMVPMIARGNPFLVRYQSTTSTSSYPKEEEIIKKEEEREPLHQVEEFTPKELASGAPNDLITDRIVRIYKESKPATQSGANNTKFWKIDWDILGKGNRWENDMMGYQGSSDYMQGTRLSFDSEEAAIRFAQGQGWNYYIQTPKVRKFKKKDYSANFLHSSGPLKHIRTK